MIPPALDDRVTAGLAALDRHAWQEAFDLLKAADADHLLGGAELEQLGQAEWWLGRLDDSLGTTERAYEAYIAAGNHLAAAHVALELARGYAWKSARSQALGWLARAGHLVESQPESPVLAKLLLTKAMAADAAQELERAEELAKLALEVAERFGRRDEAALAMELIGSLLARRGELARGFGLVDESTAMAVGGELSARATGVVYCQTIALCHDVADFERASEWTDAAARWCERRSIAGGFPGICRVHRAEMLRLRGAWERANSEAATACEELPGYNPQQAGAAFREVGELRLRMGDLGGADEAFAAPTSSVAAPPREARFCSWRAATKLERRRRSGGPLVPSATESSAVVSSPLRLRSLSQLVTSRPRQRRSRSSRAWRGISSGPSSSPRRQPQPGAWLLRGVELARLPTRCSPPFGNGRLWTRPSKALKPACCSPPHTQPRMTWRAPVLSWKRRREHSSVWVLRWQL